MVDWLFLIGSPHFEAWLSEAIKPKWKTKITFYGVLMRRGA